MPPTQGTLAGDQKIDERTGVAGYSFGAFTIWGCFGVPPNPMGVNGDFCFRSDGTVAGHTIIYHKEAGVWVATAA